MDVDNLHQMWKGRPLENSITEEGTNQRKVQDRQTDGGRLNEKQTIKTCLLVLRPISGSKSLNQIISLLFFESVLITVSHQQRGSICGQNISYRMLLHQKETLNFTQF